MDDAIKIAKKIVCVQTRKLKYTRDGTNRIHVRGCHGYDENK